MKKKIFKIGVAVICVVLFIFLLVPTTWHLDDGGTVAYCAKLYSVYDVHRQLDFDEENSYEEGIIVEILGIEVFNNVK